MEGVELVQVVEDVKEVEVVGVVHRDVAGINSIIQYQQAPLRKKLTESCDVQKKNYSYDYSYYKQSMEARKHLQKTFVQMLF